MEKFVRIKSGEDYSQFPSLGMDVYANSSKANLNILGNAVYPGEKFAISEPESRLERYLRKGQAVLVANAHAKTADTEIEQEAAKPKKKKQAEESKDVVEIIEEAEVAVVVEPIVEEPQNVTEVEVSEPSVEG